MRAAQERGLLVVKFQVHVIAKMVELPGLPKLPLELYGTVFIKMSAHRPVAVIFSQKLAFKVSNLLKFALFWNPLSCAIVTYVNLQ